MGYAAAIVKECCVRFVYRCSLCRCMRDAACRCVRQIQIYDDRGHLGTARKTNKACHEVRQIQLTSELTATECHDKLKISDIRRENLRPSAPHKALIVS